MNSIAFSSPVLHIFHMPRTSGGFVYLSIFASRGICVRARPEKTPSKPPGEKQGEEVKGLR
ncbi:GM14044 [Drosophila sechellia]|uniref:GM14044 n=1 Tax=Drosophila sechellia TaxID=7238 RepID=B4HTT5_DROSE|nr:GM14044 [Drosophila sechellia]